MGKPRMIILVRHAQSEGNKNRDIHQFIPDHRVKLTQHGWNQAEEAGRQLRSMLKPDDTLQFFTSPYRRTRETAEGILRTLTADDPTPSPFARHKIKVFEEPRLREQDFGNFQPCSAEMERMWQERADYGHFFYRIPDGESAADAYDRIAGFNESLWRQFGDADFPSVCVLVTHGLMTRVFLMKWYHWSVEYFEDLRNINHCEFIVMKQSLTNQKYILQNELRTWSDLKRRAAAANTAHGSAVSSSPAKGTTTPGGIGESPVVPMRRWGGCVNGCDHDKMNWPRRPMRKNTMEYGVSTAPAHLEGEKDDHPIAAQEAAHGPTITEPSPSKLARHSSMRKMHAPTLPATPASPNDASNDSSSGEDANVTSEGDAHITLPHRSNNSAPRTAAIMGHLVPPTPGEGLSDDSDYFPGMRYLHHHGHAHGHASPARGSTSTRKSSMRASSKQRQESRERKMTRKMSEQSWKEESGMLKGARADALGDGDDEDDEIGFGDEAASSSELQKAENDTPILSEALKGDMVVEHTESERAPAKEDAKILNGKGNISEADIDKMKEAEQKGLGEVY